MVLRLPNIRSVRALLIAVIVLMGSGAGPAAAAGPSEFAVKAAFLLRFGDFITWPDGALGDPHAPVAICVVGHNPFGRLLVDTVKDQSIQGHPVIVVEHASLASGTPCHVVYIGASSQQTVTSRIMMMADKPVLTVTDGQVDGADGIINFVIQDNRVRFAIDPAAAKAAGIEISSKLLALAVNLKR